MKFVLLWAFVLPFAIANPLIQTSEDEGEPHPEEQEGLFEGDIEMTEELEKELFGNTQSRDTISGRQRLWPNNVMHYVLDSTLNSRARQAIQAAMSHITSRTSGCIKFAPRTNQLSYVRFFPGNGCFSTIGHVGREQRISIGRGCEYEGIAIHEILHALGFFHEQSRIDRDNFVTIRFENIRPGLEYNFRKYRAGQASTLGLPYDYESIMHYSSRAFSINGQNTIETKNPRDQGRIGQRRVLSSVDIRQLRSLYSCSGSPPDPPTDSPTAPPSDGPCSNYNVLDSADRSVNNRLDIFNPKSDANLVEGWYRITGAAGNQMPRQPPRARSCGTYVSGWLQAPRQLPTQADGPVQATVCFTWYYSCWRRTQISVANCGNFFVYRLRSPPGPFSRFMRYCGSP